MEKLPALLIQMFWAKCLFAVQPEKVIDLFEPMINVLDIWRNVLSKVFNDDLRLHMTIKNAIGGHT